MGLDMYLSAREYVNRHDYTGGWENKTVRPEFEQVINATDLSAFVPADSIYGANVTTVTAYWRKANAIHQWFVDNVQNGEDDCKEYYVSTEDLQKLADVCRDVIAHKDDPAYCEDVLPTSSGFFFGSTEIDEWYFQDIIYTAERLDEILATYRKRAAEGKYVDFTYQSSW